MVQELKRRLSNMGMQQMTGRNRIQWNDHQKVIILKVVISGAFYPNMYTTDVQNDPMLEYQVFHALNGRDPTKTVYFSGFTKENVRELYVNAIQDLFKRVVADRDVSSIGVSFDDDSEKVFVTFDTEKCNADRRQHWESMRATIPGRIPAEVYKAIKLRHSPMQLSLLPPAQERKLAADSGIAVMLDREYVPKTVLHEHGQDFCRAPRLEDTDTGRITCVETCSKFWFQPSERHEVVEHFDLELNAANEEWLDKMPLQAFKLMNKSIIVVGVREQDGRLKRGRLTNWMYDDAKKNYRCTIRFIDTGELQATTSDQLRVFNEHAMLSVDQAKAPPNCYQCCLAEVKPSLMNVSGGNQWEKDTIDYMQQLVEGKMVTIEVGKPPFLCGLERVVGQNVGKVALASKRRHSLVQVEFLLLFFSLDFLRCQWRRERKSARQFSLLERRPHPLEVCRQK